MNLNKNNYWFSLIEIIIATSIITITVFWVYKLISENTKIINNSWEYLQANSLFNTIEECIKNKVSIPYNNSSPIYFYLNNDYMGCQLNTTSSWNIIDSIEYVLWANLTDTWTNYNEWEIFIKSDTIKTQTWHYEQTKK